MNATQPPAGFPVLSEPPSGPGDHSLLLVGETRRGWVGRQSVGCERAIQMGGRLIIIPPGLASLASQAAEGGEGKLLSKSASFYFLPTSLRVFVVLDSGALMEGLAVPPPPTPHHTHTHQQPELPCLGPILSMESF